MEKTSKELVFRKGLYWKENITGVDSLREPPVIYYK
jgi:hypothetical protein